jgi:hypothetical protein
MGQPEGLHMFSLYIIHKYFPFMLGTYWVSIAPLDKKNFKFSLQMIFFYIMRLTTYHWNVSIKRKSRTCF